MFSMHVPVWNGSGWMFVSIRARLDVQAVADAQLSEVSLGSVHGAETWANHLEAVEIAVVARDVDGAPIHRTGERIVVRIVSTDRMVNQTEIAQFDATRAVYFVEVTIGQPGEHAVFIETEAGEPVRKARIWVACVNGYAEVRGECVEVETGEVQAVVGGTIGAVFLIVVVLGLGLLHKNRAHALRFALLFFKREFLLVYKMMTQLWDICGDGMPAAAHSVPSFLLRWRGRVHRR
jgi:hypothetical protein